MADERRHKHRDVLSKIGWGSIALSGPLIAVPAKDGAKGYANPWMSPFVLGAVGVILFGAYVLVALFRGWWLPGGFEKHSVPQLVFRDQAPVFPRIVRRVWVSNESVPVTGAAMVTTSTTDFGGMVRRDEVMVWIVYVEVENVPSAGDDRAHATARNVHGTLRFSDQGGAVIAELPARWSHHDQYGEVERTQAPAHTDLPPDGGPFRLDVAIKYPEDSECYTYNDEARFTTDDLRARPLGAEPVTVDVMVTGADTSSSARYHLSHDGVGDKPPSMTRVE